MELIEAVISASGGQKKAVLFRPIVRSVKNKYLKIELDSLCRNGNRLVLDFIPGLKNYIFKNKPNLRNVGASCE